MKKLKRNSRKKEPGISAPFHVERLLGMLSPFPENVTKIDLYLLPDLS